MFDVITSLRELTQGVFTALASLRTSTPDVMKRFGELGRAATARVAVLPRGIRSLEYPGRVG